MAVAGRSQPVPAVISRNSLADAPVLTTPGPWVVQAAATPGWGAVPPWVTSRASLQDFATPVTPAPLVVTTALTAWGKPQAAIIAAAPVPPVPLAGAPQPLIVALAVKLAAAQPPVILRSTVSPFTVGALSASVAAGAVLGATDTAVNALTASTAPSSTN